MKSINRPVTSGCRFIFAIISLFCFSTLACPAEDAKPLSAEAILDQTFHQYSEAPSFRCKTTYIERDTHLDGLICFVRNPESLTVEWSDGADTNRIVLTNGILTTAAGKVVTNRDGFFPPFFQSAGVSRTLSSVVPPLLLKRRFNYERAQFTRAQDETLNGRPCYRVVSQRARLNLLIDVKTKEIVQSGLGEFGVVNYEIQP